ncbi:hypothetical protein Tco_0409546 [Tanacetum coccineum]
MVACLERIEGKDDFHQILDFLNASIIRYSLTISPIIYASYIEQFWATAKSKIVNNEMQILDKVDGKTIVILESSVRSNLHFNDEDGVTSLTNSKILENLALMGYEIVSDKLTFQKAFFSPQWKYLIHTILHCLSSKSTAWNEFSTNIASTVICLENNQKFNFSKLIFDGSGPRCQVTILQGGGAEAQTRFEAASKQSNDPPLSRVNTLGSGEDNMKLKELMELCTMVCLPYCDQHNMVALLEKTDGTEGFHQIVDFLNASHIRFALSENPTIYDSHIKQFWQTATVNTLDNEEQK